MTPDEFLEEVRDKDKAQYALVKEIQRTFRKYLSYAEVEVKYGGLLYSIEKPVGGIFVSKNHVSVEFSNGSDFSDPEKLLLGSGKYRRHLKFDDVDQVKSSQIDFFLKQI